MVHSGRLSPAAPSKLPPNAYDDSAIAALRRAGVPGARAREIVEASSRVRESLAADVDGGAVLLRPTEIAGVLKGTAPEHTAVILPDGSVVIHQRKHLGKGGFRRAKAVWWMSRSAEGPVQVEPACKLGGEIVQRPHAKTTKDGRHFTPSYQRSREAELQRALISGKAEHVLLPKAAYFRPSVHLREFQIFAKCDRDLKSLILRDRRLLPRDRMRATLPYLEQAARGVAEIHAVGWRHNDVKPSNVLLRGCRAWIADLGICSRPDVSRIGGTRRFCRPELYRVIFHGEGLEAPLSTENDVYGLGLTLLAIWCGGLPQLPSDLDARKGATAEVVARIRGELSRIIDAVSHPILRKVVRAATGIDDVLSASAFADALLQLQREL